MDVPCYGMRCYVMMHEEMCLTHGFVHHCNVCLHLSSVGCGRSTVISMTAAKHTSILRDHTETATAPTTAITKSFQRQDNTALSLGSLPAAVCLLFHLDASMCSCERNPVTMSVLPNLARPMPKTSHTGSYLRVVMVSFNVGTRQCTCSKSG